MARQARGLYYIPGPWTATAVVAIVVVVYVNATGFLLP